tara:strand:- start:8063 stop:9289 length:1227 start_codon:yes stop_codon:yes gene_type:complete
MLSISKENVTLFISFLIITVLPSLFKQWTHGTSYAAGILIAGFFVLILISLQKGKILLDKLDFTILAFFSLFIFSHFLFTWLQSIFINLEFDYNLFRWASSLLGLYLMILSSQILANYMNQNINENEFSNNLMLFSLIILLFAFLAIIGVNPFFANTETRSFDKPMFVYGEPSHFFLTYGSFILYFLINSKFKNIFMLCLLFILAKVKSMVFAVQLLIYSFLSYKKYFFVFLLLFTIPVFLSFDYYYSRIDFFSENRSLSVNAFISGVMRAYISLFETNFLGFGFNQFGLSNLDTITSHYVYGLAINSEVVANKLDGTILSAKLIGEFGIFGILVIIFYLIFFFRYMIFILKSNLDYIKSNPVLFFMLSIYMTFFIDLFVRSPGYFTSHFYLFLLACSYLHKNGGRLK